MNKSAKDNFLIVFGFILGVILVYSIVIISAITLTQITPANNITTSNASQVIEINISAPVSEGGLNNLTFSWDIGGSNAINFTPYDDSLVLFMNFDNRSSLGENDTRVVDLSKYGNNGTVVGGSNISWTPNGKYGGAFNFSGGVAWIDGGDISSNINYSNSYTLAGWFNINANVSGTYYIILSDNYDSSNSVFDVRVRNNYAMFAYKNSTGTGLEAQTTANSIIPNQWYFFTFKYDKENNLIGLYLNGDYNINRSITTDYSVKGTTRNLNIGSQRDGTTTFNGSIDDVMVFNRSLSGSEISQLYKSSLTKYDSQNWSFSSNQSFNYSTSLINATNPTVDFDYHLCSSNSSGSKNCTSQKTITQTIPNKVLTANFTNQIKIISTTFYGINTASSQGLLTTDEEDSNLDCVNDRDANYSYNRQMLINSGTKSIRWGMYLQNRYPTNKIMSGGDNDREIVKFAYDNNLKVSLIALGVPTWQQNRSSYCNSTDWVSCPPTNSTDWADLINIYINNVTNNGEYISAIDSVEILNEPEGSSFLNNLTFDNSTKASFYIEMVNASNIMLNNDYPNIKLYLVSSYSTTTTNLIDSILTNFSSDINNSNRIKISYHSYWRVLFGGRLDRINNQTEFINDRCNNFGINCSLGLTEWNYNKDDSLMNTQTHAMGNAYTISALLNHNKSIDGYLFKWGTNSANDSCSTNNPFKFYDTVSQLTTYSYNVTKNFANLCPASSTVYSSSSDDSTIKTVTCKKGTQRSLIVINTDIVSKNVSINLTSSGISTLTNYENTSQTFTASGNTSLGIMDSYDILYLTEDLQPPTITINSPTSSTYSQTNIDFNITLDEEGSWCGYSLNSGSNISMNKQGVIFDFQKTVSITNGNHKVVFTCNDTSNNYNSTNISFTVYKSGGFGGGGESGYGGSSCNPLWICEQWSSCSNNLRSRNCVDISYCNSNENPPLLLSCSLPLPSDRISGCVRFQDLNILIYGWKKNIYRFDILDEAIWRWRGDVGC